MAIPRIPGLVISPFLSRSTRERLRAENLNFLDLTGNVRLVLPRPGRHVETQGAEIHSPKRPPGRSIAGRKLRGSCVPSVTSAASSHLGRGGAGEGGHQLCVAAGGVAVGPSAGRAPTAWAGESVHRPALIRRWAQDYEVLTTTMYAATRSARPGYPIAGSEGAIRKIRADRFDRGQSDRAYRSARLAMLYVETLSQWRRR